MLRFAYSVLVLSLVLGLTATVIAEDKKEDKKIEGTITCAKCDLGKADSCATVIKAKEGNKEVIYWFDKASHGKHHGAVCSAGKEGTVTGTVTKEGDKMIIKVTKLEFKK